MDFGTGVGSREVFLYNLPEVATCHETLGIGHLEGRSQDMRHVAVEE